MKEIKSKPPVVFQFQPQSFKVFETPEELKEWERLMREEVGFRGALPHASMTGTESCSCGCSDDCDQD